MMEFIVPIFIFFFGTIVGSFLNVVILRKNTGESIVWDSSHCFSCGHKLGPANLIPIFSFLFAKGRCGYCGSKISWQYPIVEFLVGIIFVLVYLKNTSSPSFYFALPAMLRIALQAGAFSSLLLIAVYDYKQKIIDTHFLIIFSAFVVIPWIFWRELNLSDFISSFFITLFFYLMWRFSDGRWMGRGDVNLVLPLSLFLGWPINLAMLFISFWLGGLVGVLLLIFKNKKYGLKSEIPFGPFLVFACFIVWYASSFFESFWMW
ncbi:MAG: prepilin peptidase [bacterium]|nr:prepilin peptidase [bacterium]